MNLSGVLFILIVSAISLTSALDNVGTLFEQLMAFTSQAMTYFVLIGLFGVWQGISVYKKPQVWKGLAYSCPAITIINTIYPMIEYSEQSVPSSFIYTQGMELILSMIVASIFAKEALK